MIIGWACFVVVFAIILFLDAECKHIGRAIETEIDRNDRARRIANIDGAVGKEPLVGFRGWALADTKNGRRLQSLFRRETIWKPGRAQIGDTHAGGNDDQGVYAFKTMDQLLDFIELHYGTGGLGRGSSQGLVYGTVALAGRIIEHEKGYRAEAAYPTLLIAEDDTAAKQLRRAYGCEAISRTSKNREA